MSAPYIVDLDDFHQGNHRIDLLDQLRATHPRFCATLFTIPGLCEPDFLKFLRDSRPWLDLVPHGWLHPHSRECEGWNETDTIEYLERIAPLPLARGFKAPGWQISDATFRVLAQRGYWIADQPYNRGRRPAGLKFYELGQANRIHGHLGHMGGFNSNEIELILPTLQAIPDHAEFGFVREALETA